MKMLPKNKKKSKAPFPSNSHSIMFSSKHIPHMNPLNIHNSSEASALILVLQMKKMSRRGMGHSPMVNPCILIWGAGFLALELCEREILSPPLLPPNPFHYYLVIQLLNVILQH